MGASSARFGTALCLGSLALAAAFLAYHRADLTQAAAAVSAQAVAHRPLVRVAELASSAAGAAIASLIVLAWYGAGDLVVSRLTAPLGGAVATDALVTARAIAYGAGVWSLVWFTLGLAGLYTPPMGVAALIVGMALGGYAIARRRPAGFRALLEGWWRRAPAPLPSTVVVVPLGAALIAALAPPTAKDSLMYHMALPKTFAAAAALIVVPTDIPSYFPFGIEMHGLWAMLVGRSLSLRVGEAAFGATLFAFFPLLLGVAYGWARRAGVPRPWALTAAALVAAVPTVYDVAASAYVDLALAVYVALAVAASAQWWVRPESRHLADVALALGFALAVKLLALFPLLLVALILLGRVLIHRHAAPAPGRLAAGAAAALASATVLAMPWYVRTWAASGSPAFPFLMEIWPARVDGWDVQRSALLQALTAQYGPSGAVSRLLTPVIVSLTGWREVPGLYEGVLGPAFLVGLVLVTVALYRRLLGAEFVITAAAGVAIAVWWAVSGPVLRYLLPALAPLAVASAAAAVALARNGNTRVMPALMLPAAASLVVTLAWFVADAPVLPVVGSEARADYLTRRLDYYPYYRLVNETLPADARVWLIDMRRDTYYLERPYFADYFFEDHTLGRWAQSSTSVEDLRARARRAGITHLLVRHDVLLDYARSVLVDDSRPREENLARLDLVRSFFVDGTTILRADGKFLLAALPSTR